MTTNFFIRQLFDHESYTYTYLLADLQAKEAILIDSVREQSARDLKLIQELGLTLKYLLETHVHADHITGASELRKSTGAKVALSAVANVAAADIGLNDGDELSFGAFSLRALQTPGHTDSCMSFVCNNYVFTGDVLFVRDVGRTDFQQGSNGKMFDSITNKLFTLPDATIVYPAHDYQGRSSSTIGEEKKFNLKLGSGKNREQFETAMAEMKLALPKKIHIAVPANLRCGEVD